MTAKEARETALKVLYTEEVENEFNNVLSQIDAESKLGAFSIIITRGEYFNIYYDKLCDLGFIAKYINNKESIILW